MEYNNRQDLNQHENVSQNEDESATKPLVTISYEAMRNFIMDHYVANY